MSPIPQHTLFALLALLCWTNIRAQLPEEEAEEMLLGRIENLVESMAEEDVDHTSLTENLEWLYAHPINLNNTSARELQQLFMLSTWQMNNLLHHIRQHGELISLYELQTVDGFDEQTIEQILPFVTIADSHPRRHFSLDNMFRDGEHVLFLRYQQLLEEQRGFSTIEPAALEENPNARYLGSPCRLYMRYRFTYYQNVSFGITAEKDPGEEFFRGSQPQGFDFYSAHLHLRDFGHLRALSVGDYLVQAGQGLTLWSGMGFGKGVDAIGIIKNGMGLRQYTSVDENNFMRGLGATLGFGPVEVTAFYSSKLRDATVIEKACPTDGKPVISSLQQSGLHRTPRELEGKNAVHESILGTNVRFQGERLHAGVTAFRLDLEAHLQRNLSFYNQFDFSQSTYQRIGVDYGYLSQNINFFGEVAMSDNGTMAFLNGLMISMHHRFSLAVLHRRYNMAYHGFMASAFGENTRANNEEGLYTGAGIRITPRLRLHAFADHFRFPWMKFRTYMPSRGSDYLINLEYRPTRQIECIARFRHKSKPLNTRQETRIRTLEDVSRTQYRLHLAYPLTSTLSCRTRMEIIRFRHGDAAEQGFMIYHDILYRSLGSPVAITFRYAIFDTCGFNARIYAYEHDVLYAFSFPFMADKGVRTYLLLRYKVTRQIDLYTRLARTTFTNRNDSGSGLDQVEGNTRTEIKAQIRWRF